MAFDLTRRASGVLLHLSSLPGPIGHGDLGPGAHAFASWLAKAGQSWWQMLPIGPAGGAGSPYQSPSAFAGDPLFISLERLCEDGWLDVVDLPPASSGPLSDPELSAQMRDPLLRRAWLAFHERCPASEAAAFVEFCSSQNVWLDDYALFIALKKDYQGRPWTDWESGFRDRQAPALENARRIHADEMDFQRFQQWQFHRQWQALKTSANEKGIGLIGDLPIFVSHDSADVWAARELFDLDDHGHPLHVAGVPPDYFSEEGQHWGNPLYRWDMHRSTAYRWWVARFWRLFQLFDAVRVDHFIGFHRYWAIPAGAASAKAGAYLPGPGAPFFEAIREELGGLPIIAEDLGVVTHEVDDLRKQFGFPGMRVLQFSFGGDPSFLPKAYPEDSVAYTGTHDNNTLRGWLDGFLPGRGETPAGAAAGAEECKRALDFSAQYESADPVLGLLEGVWATQSRLAVAPVQDLLGLGAQARMNVPGTIVGNWRFRLEPGALGSEIAQKLLAITQRHRRT